MTRSRTPKPTAPALSEHIRAALAQGWHTLDALEALAGRVPAARHRVHAALAELRAGGVVLEERVTRGVAEVRELPPVADGATCPACKAVVREHDDHHGWCAVGIRDCSWWAERAPAYGPSDMAADLRSGIAAAITAGLSPLDVLLPSVSDPVPTAETSCAGCGHAASHHRGGEKGMACERAGCGCGEWQAPPTLPAPPPPRPDHDLTNRVTDLARECMEVGVSGPHGWAEAIDSLDLSEEEAERMRPVWTSAQDAWRRERVEGEQASAAPSEPATALDATAPPCEPSAPVEAAGGPVARATGPGSRCAECNRRRDLHHPADAHPFAPKPRGRPRVAAVASEPPLDAPSSGADARAVYEAIKAAGNVRVVAEGGEGSATPVYAPAPDAASEARRMVPPGGGAEPETPRGESEASALDAIREVIEPAPPSVRERVRARRVQASREAAIAKPPRCRPPLCHRDDIHEPARVRGFARPLCEACRAWVEGAGGTLAAGGIAGVVAPPRALASTPPDLRAFRRSGYTTGPLIHCEHAGMGERGRCAEGEMDGHLVLCETEQGVEGVVVYVPVGESWDVGAMRAEILEAVRAGQPSAARETV